MAITKNRREEADEHTVFEAPTAEVFADNDPVEKVAPEDDERYNKLAELVTDLQKQMRDTERANMALLSNPQWASQTTQTYVENDPNKVQLPDPALDPDGYEKAVAQRIAIREDNRRRKDDFDRTQKQSRDQQVETLWADFSDRYPAYSGDQERIDFVATKIVKEAMARGVNAERYMTVTRDKFMDDVAKTYDKIFGEPDTDEDDDNYDENASRSRRAPSRAASQPRSRRRDRSEDEHVGRTSGIFGGTESGGRPSRARDEETGPSMVDDLQSFQKKSGFF